MRCMRFNGKDLYVSAVHHLHVTVIEYMRVMTIHQDKVGLVKLTFAMEVVDQHFAIFGEQFFVDVPFL